MAQAHCTGFLASKAFLLRQVPGRGTPRHVLGFVLSVSGGRGTQNIEMQTWASGCKDLRWEEIQNGFQEEVGLARSRWHQGCPEWDQGQGCGVCVCVCVCVCSGRSWGRPQQDGDILAPSPQKPWKLTTLLAILELSFGKRAGWGRGPGSGCEWGGRCLSGEHHTGGVPGLPADDRGWNRGEGCPVTPDGWEAGRHGPRQGSDVC